MQSLEHNELLKHYQTDLAEQTRKAAERQETITSVAVSVTEDYKSEAVVLTIGGQSLFMTAKQARDLSLEIRKSSNLVEKDQIDRGVKRNGRKGHRR